MPKRARFSEEFGRLITETVGRMSLYEAGELTKLSYETIRKMKMGKVAEKETIERFLIGFPDADAHEIMMYAGYEEPRDTISAISMVLMKDKVLSERTKLRILEQVRRMIDQDQAE